MSNATHLFVKYYCYKTRGKKTVQTVDFRVIDSPLEFEYIRGYRYIKQPKEYKVKRIAVDDIISIHFIDLSY